MIEVFSEEEKKQARRSKKRLITVWSILAGVYLAIMLTTIITASYLVSELRNRDYTFLLGAIAMISSLVFLSYTLFFFSIKFRLTRKYVRMLKDIDMGLRDEVVAKFVGYDENITMKDGVYFYSMILDTKPLRREDITERKVLIEHTIPKIKLYEGAPLRISAHANIMVSYELL